MNLWYSRVAPSFETKNSKSIIHSFAFKEHKGLTINPYQGCQHRCGYCYATYEWSPEFYDKIYIKINAAEVLERQIRSSKVKMLAPVMVASATDAYQPAEIRYELTRKCIQVLQKYNVPYYIFTKSTTILRDLALHKEYRDKCLLVWSITACDEGIRRLIEPGTPPSGAIFNVIRKFVDNGVLCAVNIDPILPLITDSEHHFNQILDACSNIGVRHVFGSLLRLRADIWERMKIILTLLGINEGIERYKKTIYQFSEPIEHRANIVPNTSYEDDIMNILKYMASRKGMTTEVPKFRCDRHASELKSINQGHQLKLMTY